MTGRALLLEGGGSSTWVGLDDGCSTSWRKTSTLDPHSAAGYIRIQAAIAELAHVVTTGVDSHPLTLVLAGVSIASNDIVAGDIANDIARHLLNHNADPAHGVVVLNDIVPLLDWTPRTSSVVAICGTGTGYASRSSTGAVRRASAAEYVLSDEGGGFDLGLAGLRAATRGLDGRGPTTALTEVALRLGGGSFQGLKEFIYGPGAGGLKQRVASFAPAVLEVSRTGDGLATALVQEAARHIVAGILAVLGEIAPIEATLTMTGSVLCSEDGRYLRLLVDEFLCEQKIVFGKTVSVPDARKRLTEMARDIITGHLDSASLSTMSGCLPAASVRHPR